MVNELKHYLSSLLGVSISLSPEKVIAGKLPMALSQRYKVYSGDIFDHKTYFAFDCGNTTPSGYEKECALIKRIAGAPVVIVNENLNPVDVHRMIQKRIDFIVPGKRMFVPSLMIDLGGRYASREVDETIPPTAQLIILFQLLKGNVNGLDANGIADKFGVTYLTASRALKWIGEKISPLKEDGRKHLLDLPTEQELLRAAKAYLRTPVIKRIQTDEPVGDIHGVAAGECALEEYSMIVASGECKAVSKETKFNVALDSRGLNTVEIWMYDPKILAEGGVCDKLSLILSLADNADERVRKEVETIKMEIGW